MIQLNNNNNVLILAEFTNEMTLKLLEIVGTKVHHLNDKMHTKKKIWFDIATEMQNNGYLINYNGTKAADKCHQRWRNLEKMYRGHCQYMKSTGTGKKKPPKYFDEMHDLIGEKHSSQPVNLLDSLDNFSTTSDTCSSEVSEVTNNNENFPNTENIAPENNMSTKNASKKEKDNLKISSIFENVKKTVRPKKDNLSIVLKELHEQDIQIENQRFEKFQTLLMEQNELKKKTLEQGKEYIKIMKSLINLEAHKKSKKRKYSSDSDSA